MYAAVAIGAVLGALARFQAGILFDTGTYFPWNTFVINVSGCFLLGWFLTATLNWWPLPAAFRIGFGTGFVGTYTTFSSFTVETVRLMQQGNMVAAVVYLHLTVLTGIAATWIGKRLADRMAIGFSR